MLGGSRFKAVGIFCFCFFCFCFFCALLSLLEPVLLDVELSSTTKHICAHGHANLLSFSFFWHSIAAFVCRFSAPPTAPRPSRPLLSCPSRRRKPYRNPIFSRQRSASLCKRSTRRCACPWMVFTSTGAGAVTVRGRGSTGDALYIHLFVLLGNPFERFLCFLLNLT